MTHKCAVFGLFDEGYSPGEVRYILRDSNIEPNKPTFANTIRRYYYDWKKAQGRLPK